MFCFSGCRKKTYGEQICIQISLFCVRAWHAPSDWEPVSGGNVLISECFCFSLPHFTPWRWFSVTSSWWLQLAAVLHKKILGFVSGFAAYNADFRALSDGYPNVVLLFSLMHWKKITLSSWQCCYITATRLQHDCDITATWLQRACNKTATWLLHNLHNCWTNFFPCTWRLWFNFTASIWAEQQLCFLIVFG